MKAVGVCLITTLLCHSGVFLPVAAEEAWMARIPNAGLVMRNGVLWPAVGHTTPKADTNDDENQFGEDFEDVGNLHWTREFCLMDSDGDGITNGMELGDPDCVWKEGDTPARTHTISHPGFADSTPVFTPAPPTTAAPPLPTLSNGTTITPAAPQSEVNGKMLWSWTILPTTNELQITMNATGDHYVSVGVSPQLMDGPMVACYVAATGTAKCSDWDGIGLAVVRMSARISSIVSSSRAGNTYTITVNVGISDFDVRANTLQRVIFATGAYNMDTDVPAQHTAVDRAESNVNFYSVVSVAGQTQVPVTAVPTTAAPIVRVTVPANASVATRSPSFQSAEGISYNWTTYKSPGSNASDGDDDVIELTMGTTRDQYVSIGVSPQLMDGPMVACYVSSGATTVAQCSDWMGVGLTITPMTQVTELVSWRLTDGGARRQSESGSSAQQGFEVTIRVKASDFNVDTASGSGAQRVIFAVGQYNAASNIPLIHTPADRSSAQVDLYTGESKQLGTKKGFTIVTIIIVVVCVVVLLIAAILNFNKIVFRPRTSTLLRVVGNVVFIAFLVMYFVGNLADYKASVRSYPVERALGDATVLCFWFVLYPVPKHVGFITTVSGVSWERLLTYHIVVGTAAFLMATAHFIAMALTFSKPFAAKELFSTSGPNPALYGFLAWLFTAIVVLSSLFLRRKFYALFRLLHWLFIPVIVFSVLHYKKLLWALLPPMINLVVDWLLRLVSHFRAAAHVIEATATDESEVASLRIALAPGFPLPRDGEYLMVSRHWHLPGAAHPFTVAWTKPSAHPAEPNEVLLLVKSMGKNTWSDRLLQDVRSGNVTPGTALSVTGPYGSLQVPTERARNLFFVAGGIGVTPTLNMLQTLAQANAKPESTATPPQSVTVVWSLRTYDLAAMLKPYFQEAAAQLQAMGVDVQLHIFLTQTQLSAVPKDACQVYILNAGRPDLNGLITSRRNILPMFTTRSRSQEDSSSSPSSAIYVCGPQSLMDCAEAVAQQTPNTFFHSELFEF